MRLVDLMRLANKGYEGRTRPPIITLRGFFHPRTGKPIPDASGDGLAKFIVQELYETFDEGETDQTQLDGADVVMKLAQDQLTQVREAIYIAGILPKKTVLDKLAAIRPSVKKAARIKGKRSA